MHRDHRLQSCCCLPAVGSKDAVKEQLLCLLAEALWLLGGCGRGLDQPLKAGAKILWLCILNAPRDPLRWADTGVFPTWGH